MPAPEWLSRAVFYQIFPPSFCDANGDGIGDLKGLETRLDYLAELGINALLVNACFASPFRNGGYDVSDHRSIAPRYGTHADVRDLIEAAHARDMRICFDLVATHTALEHAWFEDAAAGRGAEERYIWSSDPRLTSADGLSFAPGFAPRAAAYAYEEFVHQPALNYGFVRRSASYQQSPEDPGPLANWAALQETIAFWLDLGLDGFRVLGVERMVRADPFHVETRRRWRALNGWVMERFPHAAMIASWGVPELATDAGFALDLLVHREAGGYGQLFGRPERGARVWLQPDGRGDFGPFWNFFRFQQERLASGQVTGLPSSGPDLPRLNDGRSEAELKLIHTFLHTWPSVPFIYYGDEIGMPYRASLPSREGAFEHAGSRAPMQWDARGGFSTNAAAEPYLPLNPEPGAATVAAQREQRDSLWHHVERLVYLRTTEQDLGPSAGVTLLLDTGPGQPVVYRRGQGIVVALNPTRASAQVRLPQLGDVTPVLSHRCQLSHDSAGWMLRLGVGAHGVFSVR
jgi:maltose alpha-D-glucosyltransferase / alpha-amylase